MQGKDGLPPHLLTAIKFEHAATITTHSDRTEHAATAITIRCDSTEHAIINAITPATSSTENRLTVVNISVKYQIYYIFPHS